MTNSSSCTATATRCFPTAECAFGPALGFDYRRFERHGSITISTVGADQCAVRISVGFRTVWAVGDPAPSRGRRTLHVGITGLADDRRDPLEYRNTRAGNEHPVSSWTWIAYRSSRPGPPARPTSFGRQSRRSVSTFLEHRAPSWSADPRSASGAVRHTVRPAPGAGCNPWSELAVCPCRQEGGGTAGGRPRGKDPATIDFSA